MSRRRHDQEVFSRISVEGARIVQPHLVLLQTEAARQMGQQTETVLDRIPLHLITKPMLLRADANQLISRWYLLIGRNNQPGSTLRKLMPHHEITGLFDGNKRNFAMSFGVNSQRYPISSLDIVYTPLREFGLDPVELAFWEAHSSLTPAMFWRLFCGENFHPERGEQIVRVQIGSGQTESNHR